MRVIISGPVTLADLQEAELMLGITPTEFVTNGLWHPPAELNLPVEVHPICTMRPDAERANNFTLVLYADALVCRDADQGLIESANIYELLVFAL